MKLVYWMYNGPAHLGTLRTASSFQNVHAIMHAPLGDDYFNVMRSMLERERDFTPVTTSIVDRHVLARGSQEKVILNAIRKDKEEQPDLILLTPTCTSSILQEDLQNFAQQANLSTKADVILADVNHYRVNEFQAADRTLEQIIRFYIEKARKTGVLSSKKTEKPSANILGIYTLGFHHQHDCRELKRILYECDIEVNLILPEGGNIRELQNLPQAWFNIIPYREIGLMSAQYLEKEFGMPYVSTSPIGLVETASFLRQIGNIFGKNSSQGQKIEEYIQNQSQFIAQSAWFSRSIDCQNLTGKKAVVFGDATHAASITKILAREMGIYVSCAGTYCKHDGDWFREQVAPYTESILITDDHRQVGEMIQNLQPNCLFGTQMERHIGKRLGIPCGVISSPSHIQNFPLGYRPFIGYEGSNQIADLVYNTNQLGMEEHLLEIFGGHDAFEADEKNSNISTEQKISEKSQPEIPHPNHDLQKGNQVLGSAVLGQTENCIQIEWTTEAEKELSRIPGFVRKKVKQNILVYAEKMNILKITPEVMYAAKENLSLK